MLLAIDIGNSGIVFGVFKGKRLIEQARMATKSAYSLSECSREVYKLPHRRDIEAVIIMLISAESDIMPDALAGLEKVLKRIFKKPILVLGRDIEAPVKNLYNKPEQVGQDRLVNAVAALAIYNKERDSHIVIIDFGTAVTFDVISKKDEYLGGLIFPGIRLSLENLTQRAALLPKIEIKKPSSFVGKDTKDSMRSGILNGYAMLCDGIVAKIRALYGQNVKVIATGGDAKVIAKYSNSIEQIDTNLTLKGLQLTHQSL